MPWFFLGAAGFIVAGFLTAAAYLEDQAKLYDRISGFNICVAGVVVLAWPVAWFVHALFALFGVTVWERKS